MTSKNKILNFDTICRTCLCESANFKPLFTFSSCLADMLMTCASVKVAADDGLPSNICTICFHQISIYFSFKNKIEKSDNYLRKYLKDLQKNRSQNKNVAADADIDITKNDEYQEKNSSESDDVINLSVRQMKLKTNSTKRQPRRVKSNANIKIETILIKNFKEEYIDDPQTTDIPDQIDKPELLTLQLSRKTELFNNPELINVSQTNEKFDTALKEEEIRLVTQIFTAGPPPLVPIIPIETDQIPHFPVDTNNAPMEVALKLIPNETPALIPLHSPTDIRIEQIKFQCNTCKEEFSSTIDLKNHMSSLHSKTLALVCNICKKEFSDRKRLIRHLKGHTAVKQYACKLCGKRYPNPSSFKVHMRSHTGERPFKCEICDKGFIRWDGLMGHMRTHNTNKPYTCEICQKGFKIACNLERHKSVHSGSKPFCCSDCGKAFSHSHNLQLHVLAYHTNERPYKCTECGKSFASSSRLKRHKWTHSGYKPYACKTCDKAYSNSTDLKNHETTHNGGPCDSDKPFICITCNKRFFHSCRLMKHMKTHEKPYACPDCMETFNEQEILNKHVIDKHGEISDEQKVQINIEHLDINNIDTITNY